MLTRLLDTLYIGGQIITGIIAFSSLPAGFLAGGAILGVIGLIYLIRR
jgi:hypothetical protein